MPEAAFIKQETGFSFHLITPVKRRGGQGRAAPAAGTETESLDIKIISTGQVWVRYIRGTLFWTGGNRAINGE
ncbi:hypothetical protein [Serratia quinivorans]|uniref:hypothetical protein n=1 Tax=Serratia quinivorans TaxID=137545 RepID=UPI0021BD5509|nr:hypothetical protein [Serratia quinivorans]